MTARRSSRTIIVLLLLIVAVALTLRVFNVGHVMSYDEAWNVNSMVDAASGHTEDPFFLNFWRHPPLYTGLGIVMAAATGSGRTTMAPVMEVVSIISALLLVIAIFACGRDWLDERAGLAAAFLFAVMPAARVFDSWVKQESMTLLFGLLFLLFFFRGRYVVAGACLGLALLTKEIVAFIPLALFIFVLVTRRFREIKGLAVSVLIGGALSAWWYLAYSRTKGQFLDFFLGRHGSAAVFRNTWYFFLKRLPDDLGLVTLVLFVFSLFVLLWQLKVFGMGDGGRERSARDYALFLFIWVLVVYLVMTVSHGKPPWLIYSALPAVALLAGWAFSEVARALERLGRARLAWLILVPLLALALSLPVGFGSFLRKADVTFAGALTDREAARYVNEKIDGGRVMLSVDDLSPNLAYYLDVYEPGSIALLPGRCDEAETRLGPDFTVMLLRDKTQPLQAVDHIDCTRPVLLLARYRPDYPGANATDLAIAFRGVIEPREFDNLWVFDVTGVPGAPLQLVPGTTGVPGWSLNTPGW